MFPITHIVITGGPAGGKSTLMNDGWLAAEMMKLGVRPFFVPEMATGYFSYSISDINQISETDYHRYAHIQYRMLKDQQEAYLGHQEMAELFSDQQPCVIFYDRAEMDTAAYVRRDYFDAMLRDSRLTLEDVRDRYDAVIHLRSLADGKPELFREISRSNPARREHDPAVAQQQDLETMYAWIGHPHLRVIDNSTDYEGKRERALAAIKRVLGIPTALEIERGFLLASPIDMSHPDLQYARTIYITQTYLGTEGKERVRSWQDGDNITYYHTQKPGGYGKVREEINRRISPLEYQQLLATRDPQRITVKKYRTCVVWGGRYWEIDHFLEPSGGELWKAEIELDDPDEEVEIPPFLDVEREVTGDKAFSNGTLSKR